MTHSVRAPSRQPRQTLTPGRVFAFQVLASAAAIAGAFAHGADWPTYRHDMARSGVTAEELSRQLAECWTFQPRHAPRPAWGDPNPRPVGGWYRLHEYRRVHFDDAYHVVVAGSAAFFGSSADGKVYCLDLATGKERWAAITGGPIRLAPTVSKGRVYVGSDDGCAYCLHADNGETVWKYQAAPETKKLLGSGKMISRWPLRTSVLVDDGVAYFAAGIFPAEGVYVYAVDAESGDLIWRNDTCADTPTSRISPQGYLLASKGTVFTPLGRVPPAAFSRKDGRLLHQTWVNHYIGGTYALLADGLLYTGTGELLGYRQDSRARFAWFKGRQIIVTKDVSYMTNETEMVALSRKTYPKASVRRFTLRDQRPALTRELRGAKGGYDRMVNTVKGDKDRLLTIDRQIAVIDKERGKEKIVALQTQREAIEKTLRTNTTTLEQLAKKLAHVEARHKAMEEEWKQTSDTMAGSARWRLPCPCPDALILAGNVLYAGGQDRVIAVDAASGKQVWEAPIDGKARGIAAARGRLIVSSDRGAIYCFGPAGSKQTGTVKQAAQPSPFPLDKAAPMFVAAAERIVRTTGITKGYCLVLGNGTGRLAAELAKRTELQICATDSGADNVATAQKTLDAAGLYGTRVHIEQAPPSSIPYSDYFANLIVSESTLTKGELPANAAEAFRMLKPCGGVLYMGQPVEARGQARPLEEGALRRWLTGAGIEGGQISKEGGLWLTLKRGPLPGAGKWTHQYAEPGNTTCSDDQLVRSPLGLLWFGEPGPEKMAERHRRPASPLAFNGRLFVQGEGQGARIGVGQNALMAYDAYNGLKLWEREIPAKSIRVGVSHDASNLVSDGSDLYVVSRQQCLRLDAATGETAQTYEMPEPPAGQNRAWGYVARVGGLLVGSRTTGNRACDTLFAVDVATGEVRWSHAGKSIPHPSISVGDGRVFFIDDNVTAEQRKQALAARLRGESVSGTDPASKNAPVRLAVALDVETGRPVWQQPIDLSGAIGGAYWSSLGTMYSKGVLAVFGVFTDGHYWRQFFAGEFGKRRVVALSTRDGAVLWGKQIGYRVRPIIVGDTFHAEPWAYDLRTGEQLTRINPVTGQREPWQFARPGHHCGCPAAAPNLMLFRSGTIAHYDLAGDSGTRHFGGQRPNCWINFVPANGLLMIPEGSSGCMCPFPTTCTLVFKPTDRPRAWAYYSMTGPMTPVKRIALNLGSPGDRRDRDGTLWFGYPRPGGSLVLRFSVGLNGWPGGGYFRHSTDFLKIKGTPSPWLYASGFRNIRRCQVPLFPAEDGRALYTVRLGFADLEHDQPGERVFNVKIQDKPVLANFDVAEEVGGRCRAIVKEFKGIEAGDKLTIDLAPKTPNTPPEKGPILQTVEVVRERVLTLGFTVPSFLLANAAPEQPGQVRIANHKDEDFVGTLRVAAPDGFAVTPKDSPIRMASGSNLEIALKASVVKKQERGTYPVSLRLLRQDGQVECERQAEIEYLADRGRVVVKASEDAYVGSSFATSNKGTSNALLVDGGHAKMADHSHHITYLKFPLDVPGKPVSAVFRIFNAGNPTSGGGDVCLVTDPWQEQKITYSGRPKPGQKLGRIGPVSEKQTLEVPLKVSLEGMKELSVCIEPYNCDGVDYLARESGKPAELVVEYQP